jgi:WD40 repeat protein
MSHHGYKAFISYSHAADGKLAPALQSGLHRFARPWYRLRAMRVFRDKTSLAVSPALWPSIERALNESEYFLLLASPEAAGSPWVRREIEHWLEHRSASTLLIVLTEGTLEWDDDGGDFDWDRTTALPAGLDGTFDEEPLFLDLRWAKNEEDLSLRDPRFRGAIADLASTLHGRPKDEMVGEDVRRHRNAMRLAWSVVAVLTLLTVISVLAAYVAIEQRNLAQERLRIAMSQNLSVQAMRNAEQLDQALLLAVEANRMARTEEATTTLQGLLERASRLEILLHAPVESFAFSPGGETLALALSDGTIHRLDATTFRPRGEPLGVRLDAAVTSTEVTLTQPAGLPMTDEPEKASSLVFTPDGESLLTASPSASYHPPLYTLHQWDLDAERPRVLRVDRTHRVALSPQGHTAAMLEGWRSGRVLFWSGVNRRAVAPPIEHAGSSPIWLAFDAAGDRAAVGHYDAAAVLWTGLHEEPVARTLPIESDPVTSAVFSGDGRILFLGTEAGSILRWDVDGEALSSPLEMHDGRIVGLGFTAEDTTLTSVSEDGVIVVWHLDRLEARRSVVGHLDPPIGAVVFSRAGTSLVALHRESVEELGAVTLWTRPAPRGTMQAATVFGQQQEGRLIGERLPVTAAQPDVPSDERRSLMRRGNLRWSFRNPPVAFSPRDERLVTALPDGGLAVWSLGAQRSLGWQPSQAVTSMTGAALSSDGRRLAWTSDDVVRLWDVEAGHSLGSLPIDVGSAQAVAFSPDGRLLVFASYDLSSRLGRIHVVDAATLEPALPPISVAEGDSREGGRGLIVELAFGSLGRRLVSHSYSGDLIAWDLEAANPRPSWETTTDVTPGNLAFDPRRSLMALASGPRIALMDLETGRPHPQTVIEAPAPVLGLAFHPGGELLAAGLEDGSVHLWNPATGQPAGEALPHESEGGAVTASLAFDAEGAHLAVAYPTVEGGSVRVWNLERREPVIPDLSIPPAQLGRLLLTPGARQVVWASDGYAPLILDAQLDSWIARACRLANRSLSEAEWRHYLPQEPYRPTCRPDRGTR